MTVEAAIKAAKRAERALYHPYDTIYKRLNPFLALLTVNERNCETVTLASKAFMDLHVERLYAEKDGAEVVSFTHYYKMNGDLCPDPDMEVRVWHDRKLAEALTFQDSFGFRRVYYPGKVDMKAKRELNSFLSQWLKNLKTQGFLKANIVKEEG
jgi:uncharacterized protein YqiB (DUF1249 family)